MNLVAWAIVTCEVLFWVVILAGFTARYIFKRPTLGLIFLALTPVLDIILLVISGVDLAHGASATTAHALAAVYISISIVFGKSMIAWADERFRYYITKQGTKPVKRYGMDHAKHYLQGFVKHLLSFALAAGILYGLIVWIDDASRTEALSGILSVWSVVVGIDLIITVTYFIWPRQAKSTS
ncbi:hypothetical protein HQN87_24215 [Paenibacillus tritici]|uniref:Integral inner membrane protein n=1 Tax=Paenibacillus tritici TaxID=1873425 RepID=A0ABX2DWS1_9BACL|nr:hypothetical protein [Paenibacillus tritici]NQX48438.1 hypothetical protein [Paenibacillus tritici]QUL56714.1 hypothetical protein KDC22_09630 [Paenibacillus tritici]